MLPKIGVPQDERAIRREYTLTVPSRFKTDDGKVFHIQPVTGKTGHYNLKEDGSVEEIRYDLAFFTTLNGDVIKAISKARTGADGITALFAQQTPEGFIQIGSYEDVTDPTAVKLVLQKPATPNWVIDLHFVPAVGEYAVFGTIKDHSGFPDITISKPMSEVASVTTNIKVGKNT